MPLKIHETEQIMEIYSLSGPSGTGKSTSALEFAHQHKITAIIDDGLLIVNGKKVAGTSAKFEKNTIKAVRRAIFSDEDHRKEVQEAIKIYVIDKLLIIGTSDKMTKLIARQLNLGNIMHFFYVEDIRSSSEIKMAQFIRRTEGKHIMPIPHKQVEQNFFKRLIQKGVEIFSSKKEKIGETTIVRPDFHRGYLKIDPKVYIDIIKHTCYLNKYIISCDSVQITFDKVPTATLSVSIQFPDNYNIYQMAENLQNEIQLQVLHHLHIEFASITIHIQSIGKV